MSVLDRSRVFMDKISGKIIFLLKNIHLQNPGDDKAHCSQFLMGKRSRNQLSGLSLTWWTTAGARKACEQVATMVQESPEFSACDPATVEGTVMDTLKQLTMDRRFFKEVFASRKATLFDCLSTEDVAAAGRGMADEILVLLRARMMNWCVVYAAPKFEGPSFSIPEDRLHVVAKTDQAAWDDLWKGRYKATLWSPVAGKFPDDKFPGFSGPAYEYLFAVEVSGTQRSAFEMGQMRLMKFFAVLYAWLTTQKKETLFRVMADPYARGLQFPGAESTDTGIHFIDLGPLVPFYGGEIRIADPDIAALRGWYQAKEALDSAVATRIDKAAHFLNRAMNFRSLDAFINYFIVLDALFGERGRVEASIVEGIKGLGLEEVWAQKASRLFDLRNELLHGGSRSVKEWPDHAAYRRLFHTDPSRDVEFLASTALWQAPFRA